MSYMEPAKAGCEIHTCPSLDGASYGGWGGAVTDIWREPPGERKSCSWWEMGNEEYITWPIYYCPFCGEELK